MGFVRKGRFLGLLGVWGCGLGIIRLVCFLGVFEGYYVGELSLSGEKNFLVRSLRFQKCWVYMFFILFFKDSKIYMFSWLLYILIFFGGLSGWFFFDFGRYIKFGVYGVQISRVLGRRYLYSVFSVSVGRGDMVLSQRCSIWFLC